MTEKQRLAVTVALASQEVKTMLFKLRLQMPETDVESCLRHPRVLQLRSRAHQIQDRERAFAESVLCKGTRRRLAARKYSITRGIFFRKQASFAAQRCRRGQA